MKAASAYSTDSDLHEAIAQTVSKVQQSLGQATANLVVLFVTHDHEKSYPQLAQKVCAALGTKNLIGCTAESVLEGGMEIENSSGLSLWAASIPNAEVELFHTRFSRSDEGIVFEGLPSQLPEVRGRRHGFAIHLGDPYSCVPDMILKAWGERFPDYPVAGAMASGGLGPGDNTLFLGDQMVEEGLVGLSCYSEVMCRTIVSQGCRPIGPTFIVTKAEKNIIRELGGLPAMQQFRDFFDDLSEVDQELVRQGPQIGVVTNEYKEHYSRGDFLISAVLGSEAETGAIAVGNVIRVGRTIQFQVRDAETATEDLHALLKVDRANSATKPTAGLLFTCNGRGSRLFNLPNHDTGLIREYYGEIPLAGLFAQGEIGPVGNRSYVHGFTASLALFISPEDIILTEETRMS